MEEARATVAQHSLSLIRHVTYFMELVINYCGAVVMTW
jgi:hypothetical protein